MLLIIISQHPFSPLAWHSYRLAKAACDAKVAVRVFFYKDAASIANGFAWQPKDTSHVQHAWQTLATQYGLELPVCVGTALARGVVDADNAKRHGIQSTLDERTEHADAAVSNLAPHFTLTGLGTLSELLTDASRVITL